jgi:hypothetical protein
MPLFIRTERGDLRLTASNCGAMLDTQRRDAPRREPRRYHDACIARRLGYQGMPDLPPCRRRQPTRARSLRCPPAADRLVDSRPSARCVNFVLT